MAKTHNVKDIEAQLKSMLNMHPRSGTSSSVKQEHTQGLPTGPPGIVVTKEDLSFAITKKQEQPQGKKKKKRKPKQAVVDPVAAADGGNKQQHHQADPDAAQNSVNGEEKRADKKKKNKKAKHTKTEVAEEGEKKNNSEGNSNNANSELDDGRKSAKSDHLNSGLKTRYLDDSLTPAILHELEAEQIFPLKKKSSKFVHAKYFCRLCDYHCDNVPVCRQHASDARHRRRKEIEIQDKKIKNLPMPSERHIAALDMLIENIYVTHGLSDEDMLQRRALADEVQAFITETVPDANLVLRLYGSSLTGFGLKTSDVNLDLVLPEGSNPAKGLVLIHKVLKESESYTNVRSVFQAKVPCVLFQPVSGSVNCQITVGTDYAYYTSQYLTLYTKLDDRVRRLAVAFRYWARVCQVDDQESGSLPSYTLGLMTVYYLQQCKPRVLPALGKDLTLFILKRLKTKEEVLNKFEDLLKEPWSTDNDQTVGSLWRNMLLFYGVYLDLAEFIISIKSEEPLRRAEKKWKSRRVAIEDPFSTKRNVARSLHNTRIFEYFYNCLRKACLYFSLPSTHQNLAQFYQSRKSTTLKQKESEELCRSEMVKDTSKVKDVANSADTEDSKDSSENVPATINVESELTNSTEISSDASIRENKFLEDGRVGWVNVSEFEDSFSKCSLDDTEKTESSTGESESSCAKSERTKSGIARANNGTCSHMEDDIDNAEGSNTTQSLCPDCDHFRNDKDTVKFDKSQPINVNVDELEDKCDDDLDCDTTIGEAGASERNKILTYSPNTLCKINETSNVPFDESILKRIPLNELKRNDSDKGKAKTEDAAISETKEPDTDDDEESEISESETDSGSGSESDTEPDTSDCSPIKKKKRVSSPVGAEYEYFFSTQTLTDGKGPSIFCQICEKEGHLKMSCPDDSLPDIIELPPLTKQHLQLMTMAIKRVPKDFQLTRQELEERESILQNLEEHVQETYPGAELCLFGSSKNGFGFHQSDLDICVTFRGKKPEDINFVEYIEAICKKLKTHRGLYNVFPITTAKVPIVKFKHRQSQLEGDISLYNILAQHNTHLLSTYARIDPRVVILGFAIKVFARVCDIGDASKGSLSSYAYMLMMLHYLQHTKPPVIPVLQELRSPDNPNPELLIEGCNAWFYEDISSLAQVWPDFGKNQQSVGELWFGFFQYYMEEFSFLEQVATIRQWERLTKFEKLWNGKCIAIEDPFDLNHNLGGGLSRKMNQYIMRTFLQARELYGLPISGVPEGFQSLEDYFFDKGKLTEGDPPSDRLCRVCSKIGHIAKECPRVLFRKERDAKEKKRREDIRKAQEDQRNRDRPSSTRSLSDPADHNSPSPCRGRGQPYNHRQHSYEQSPDKRQIRPLMDVPVADNFSRGNFHPSSPQRIPGQNFSRDRRPQSHSPNGYNIMTQSSQGQSPRNNNYMSDNSKPQFYRANQNDNSGRRYNQQGNKHKNNPQYSTNQNLDYSEGAQMHQTEGQRGYSANSNRDYASSANQSRSYISRNHPEGQVLVDLNKSYIGGGVQNAYTHTGLIPTNPAMYIPSTIIPSAAMYLSTTNMPQPASICSVTSQLNSCRSVDSRVPVCNSQAWYPVQSRHAIHTDMQLRTTLQVGAEVTERQVNLQRGSRAIPDVGVTVSNEYYRGKNK